MTLLISSTPTTEALGLRDRARARAEARLSGTRRTVVRTTPQSTTPRRIRSARRFTMSPYWNAYRFRRPSTAKKPIVPIVYRRPKYRPMPETTNGSAGSNLPEVSLDLLKLTPQQQIFKLTNDERVQHNLPPFTYNSMLESSAQKYARDLVVFNFFGHTSPDGKYYDVRIREGGYGKLTPETCNCKTFWVSFGENIAKHYTNPVQLVEHWMNSPTHRIHILSPELTDIGVGQYDDAWVQHFGGIEIDPK